MWINKWIGEMDIIRNESILSAEGKIQQTCFSLLYGIG